MKGRYVNTMKLSKILQGIVLCLPLTLHAQSVFTYDYTINCADTDKIIEALTSTKYTEKLSWTGKDIEDGSFYSLWINEEVGGWTLLKMSVEKVSCILGVGTGSTLMLGEKV